MKPFLALGVVCAALIFVSPTYGQVVVYPPSYPTVTTYYAPSVATPVTTYYAPSVATPVTTYYAPSVPVTTYYAPTVVAPVTTTYYAPAAVGRLWVPGQPVRNTLRRWSRPVVVPY